MASHFVAPPNKGSTKRLAIFIGGLSVLFLLILFALLFLLRSRVGYYYMPSKSMEPTIAQNARFLVDKWAYRRRNPKRGDIVIFKAPPEATDEHVDGIEFVKRVVGLPGEVIEVKEGSLGFDGQAYDTMEEGLSAHQFLRSRLNINDDSSVKFLPEYVLVNGSDRITKEQIAKATGHTGSRITISPGQTIINGKSLNEPFTREDPDYDFPPSRIPAGYLFVLGDNRNQSRDSHIWGPLQCRRLVGHVQIPSP